MSWNVQGELALNNHRERERESDLKVCSGILPETWLTECIIHIYTCTSTNTPVNNTQVKHAELSESFTLCWTAGSRAEASFVWGDGVERNKAFALLAVFWQPVGGRSEPAVNHHHSHHLDNRHYYDHPSVKKKRGNEHSQKNGEHNRRKEESQSSMYI